MKNEEIKPSFGEAVSQSKIVGRGLTFDDVLIVPRHSEVLPHEVDTSTVLLKGTTLNVPLVSAAMDTVTGHRMAEAMARLGALGVIHKNFSPEDQALEVQRVKRSEAGVVSDPVTIGPHSSVQEAVGLMRNLNISGLPVVEGGRLLGLLTGRDVRFETNYARRVADLMTPRARLVVIAATSLHAAMGNELFERAKDLLHIHRIEKIPLVDAQDGLIGLITRRDLENRERFPRASKDAAGRLLVAAATGVGENDIHVRIPALVEAGADIIVIDTAHGHSQGVITATAYVKRKFGDRVGIVAGNVATGAAALALAEAGADAIKVGIGPGSICTTRMIAGIGMPQISAILDVASALKGRPTRIIADGGIKYSGDVVKALAAGAHSVMIGSLFAGTEESPGERVSYQGKVFKRYRGMGSLGAMRQGSKDRYFQSSQADLKLVPEGIEGQVPYRGSVSDVVHQLVGGLRAGMGYSGARDLDDLRTDTQFVEITSAALRESHVHDVVITEEAPNYSIR